MSDFIEDFLVGLFYLLTLALKGLIVLAIYITFATV